MPPVSPPANVRVSLVNSKDVLITWDTDGHDRAYQIQGTESAGGGVISVPLRGAEESRYTRSGLAPGTYAWKVRAITPDGASPFAASSPASVTIPGNPPQNHYSIPSNAKVVPVGTDISTLGGACVLPDGNYKVTGSLNDGVKLYAQSSGKAVVIIPKGKQIDGKDDKDVALFGITFSGGGTAADDENDNAAVITGDRWFLQEVDVTGSQGVGITIKGTGGKSVDLRAFRNGTSGRGGNFRGTGTEKSGYHEIRGKFIENNLTLRKKNTANKITRCTDGYFEQCEYSNSPGGGQWLDNYNERIVFDRCKFHDFTRDKSEEDYSGPCFRSELGKPGGVKLIACEFDNATGACLSIDESSNIVVDSCTIGASLPKGGKFAASVAVRNMLRKDDDTGKLDNKGKPVDEKKFTCRLFNIFFRNCHFKKGAGPAIASGASNAPVTRKNNKISFENCVWDDGEKIEIPEK